MPDQCPVCGTTNRPGARFCIKCGARLPAAAPSPAPPAVPPPDPPLPGPDRFTPPSGATPTGPSRRAMIALAAALAVFVLCVTVVFAAYLLFSTRNPPAYSPGVAPAIQSIVPPALQTAIPQLETPLPVIQTEAPKIQTLLPLPPVTVPPAIQTLLPLPIPTSAPGG